MGTVTLKKRPGIRLDLEDPIPVQVELTQINHPQQITTVALEHPRRPPLQEALRQLQLLHAPLLPMSYRQALTIWAGNQRI